ncbi:hypothetical protein [Leuconostoc fallax]|uniref:Uncharacterized protein n=1 Tax=Leuconostoc fallax TaxID=1251 RepID=A0A4V3A297_9LACO|nr:hypothetical protein [Leuconostoc fallax]MBU7455350.1 hypothetical protein [Leuconostoc fallax]TDG67540.1 hypothetical protein C5L23_001339 [Leuconostoc fallax]
MYDSRNGTDGTDLDYNYFASLDGYPYNYVYRYVGPKTPTKSTQAVQKLRPFTLTVRLKFHTTITGMVSGTPLTRD